MKRNTVSIAATILTLAAIFSVGLALPSPVVAGGATQISGLGVFDVGGACTDAEGAEADFAVVMTGDLTGCLYTFVGTAKCSPSGAYVETGSEVFVGEYQGVAGDGTFETTYKFEAKYNDCPNLGGEIHGRCQHPIVKDSGTGSFEGVSGRIDFKDDIAAGNFPYRGHLRY